jgi:PilZ domain
MTTPGKHEDGLMGGVAPRERRRSPRAKISPQEIVYMNFQSGNGGIVLDVSSAGLGFQAATPVEGTEALGFRLSPPAIQHIEIFGQVVWLDNTRKRGGLRLSHLPVEVQKEIQRWRHQYQPPASDVEPPARAKANIDSILPGAVSEAAPAVRDRGIPSFSVPERTPKVPTRIQESLGASRSSFASAAGSGPPPNSTISSPSSPLAALPELLYSSEWNYSALSSPERSRGSRRALTASVIVGLCLVAVGSLYFGNRGRAGELVIRLGESISGEHLKASAQTPAAAGESAREEAPTKTALPATPSEAPDSSASAVQNSEAGGGQPQTSTTEQPTSNETHTSAGASGTDTGAPASEKRRTPVQTDAKNVPESTERSAVTSGRGDNGKSELAQARGYLQGTGGENRAAQLLWVAVGKGNSDAEVELANLYLRGEGGVRKNCEQARILLMAAQNNHNPQATEWLTRLRDYGCR